MSFSELYPMANRRDTTQEKNGIFSSDTFMANNDLVELVWDSGQILMQEQSSRSGKTPISDKLKTRVSDFPLSAPSCEMGLNHDDDMVRWLNFHIDDDSLEQDICSDLLNGLSGVTQASHNDFSSVVKSSLNQTDSVAQAPETMLVNDEFSPRKRCQTHKQTQTSFPFCRSRVSDLTSNDTSTCTQSSVCVDLSGVQTSSSEKLQNQDMGLPLSSSGVLNFSHFSRVPTMSKTNIQKIDPSLPSIVNNDKSAVIDSRTGLCNGMNSSTQINTTPNNVREKSSLFKPVKEHLAMGKSDTLCHVNASMNDRPKNLVVASNACKQIPDIEKPIEAAVVPSSICSVSSAGGASNDQTYDLKRKSRDTEESDSVSDDIEEQSISGKKVSPRGRGGSGSKRSRAAEVHNLSERRRRDRISEKMRSLQELIPNCNKVDKASMLDEAIEYLKTLQLQVQVLSMGAGRYMPQMMLPAGMQHMHGTHMRHFSPMGVGIGMGFNISPGYPVMQLPSRLGAHFCRPPSKFQMFGFNGQGVPHPPLTPFSLGPRINSASGSISSVVGNLKSTQVSSSKEDAI